MNEVSAPVLDDQDVLGTAGGTFSAWNIWRDCTFLEVQLPMPGRSRALLRRRVDRRMSVILLLIVVAAVFAFLHFENEDSSTNHVIVTGSSQHQHTQSQRARTLDDETQHKLEQLRLQTRWADMSDAEKMQSSGSTQERNTARRECSNESCYRAAKRWAGILPASTMKNVGSDMAVDIAGQLSGVVPYGLGLGTVSSALALEHMKLHTAVHAKGENSLHFSALEEEVKNPPGTMKPVRPCCVACIGRVLQ